MLSEKKEIFLDFYHGLSKYISKNYSEFCFFGYGSNFRKIDKHSSDLDGGIISDLIITPKETILKISSEMQGLAKKLDIPDKKIQFNLLDVKSSLDARFMSYDTYYSEFLKKYALVLAGPNLLYYLNGIDNRYGEQESYAFNLRSVRNDFLMSSFFGEDKKKEKLTKLLEYVKGAPLKIAKLNNIRKNPQDYSERFVDELGLKNKSIFIKEFQSILPTIDLYMFEKAEFLKDELIESNFDKNLIEMWCDYLSFYESIIDKYIDVFPPKEVSVKTLI